MTFPLLCFCRFLTAKSPERQALVLEQYKRQASGPVRGRCVYYLPALRLIRGKLCAEGSLPDKLTALREACISSNATEKLRDARIMSNARVFRMFRNEFGDKSLEVFPSPRLQFAAGTNVAINLQPDLYARVDNDLMIWKFGLNKKSFSESVIRAVLQMMASAAYARGLDVALHHIRYLDTNSGTVYWEPKRDPVLTGKLKAQARTLAALWQQIH